MVEVKVIKGQLCMFKDAVLQYKLGSDMVYAELNNTEDLVLVTKDSGEVELRAITGKIIRKIGNGNTHIAKWLGSDITLMDSKGNIDYRGKENSLLSVL
ncbi:hypothetical protein K5I29_04350 [Flavobacterium agricola]|uniref:Uncharacterized protein n=1 Tax=Flavobacterium agricola TaxID=2870839 RepID=A0ABY6M4L9_9FLAO|nr:hypothetical protein [Flavobacterium agricola]UYW02138.1 hypothetical protein K5I29_04350 [Flavobacterium agricola]